jgi:hypothetical protein
MAKRMYFFRWAVLMWVANEDHVLSNTLRYTAGEFIKLLSLKKARGLARGINSASQNIYLPCVTPFPTLNWKEKPNVLPT